MVPLQSPCKTENNDESSVAAGVGVVVEAGRGGGVELKGVVFVDAHKAEGPW